MNNKVLETIHKRASVRAFADRPVEPETRTAVLKAAFRAPTAGALMLYTVLDITDQNIKDRLAVTCDNQPFIAKSPMVLVFLADYQRLYDYFTASGANELCATENRPMRKPGEGDLLLAANDAIIAAQTAVIAAESLGLASCYIGDILENYEEHRELLCLPEYAFPVTMLCFGFPRASYPPKKLVPRYEEEFIVHENTYRRFEREKLLTMTAPIEGMGKVNYLGNAENFGQHVYLRKFDTGFSREMTRSVRKGLENWKG